MIREIREEDGVLHLQTVRIAGLPPSLLSPRDRREERAREDVGGVDW